MNIMLIDGNSIFNRAFYGVRLLTNRDGLYTNAIFGFLSTLFKLQDEEKPDYIIVCFDVKEKTFRHKKFESYKATRKGMPEELAVQLPVLKDVLDKMGILCCELAGYEADDLLGTISRMADEQGDFCEIVTGDRDSLQLVGGHTIVNLVSSRKGQTIYTKYDADTFAEEYGFEPIRLIDLKSLMGDSSDNIPGVPGVGEKTAKDLLHRFGSLENIYQNLEDENIKKGVREKLKAGEQSAHDSYWLATIDRQAPVPLDLNHLPDAFVDEEGLYELFTRLEFKNFIKRLGLTQQKNAPAEQEPASLQSCIITDEAELWNTVSEAERANGVTVQVSPNHAALCLLSGEKAAVVFEEDFAAETWWELFRRLFSGKIRLVIHDAKELLVTLMQQEIFPQGILMDTCLAAYMLSPSESNYDLPRVALLYVNREVPEQKVWADIKLDRQSSAAMLSSWCTAVRDLADELKKRLEELPQLRSLYFDLELPLMTVLADMQRIGCRVDPARLHEFGKMLDERTAAATAEIYQAAGHEFNINSPKQLGEVLFEELGLPVIKKTKSGYSTSAEVLEALAGFHPIVGHILEYRKVTKLKSTYVDGLLKVIDPSDGRIHSHFQQTVTATGRLSSVDPNLQNIPVRTELGRELRRMFLAEDEEHVLIDADYSQIELRVLAHISGDAHMIQAFKEGQDIHTATAAKAYGVSPQEVTPQMRSSCKAVNFGIVYGISDFALAGDLSISRKEAGAFIRSYLETYPGVDRYMQESKAFAHEHGYVETLLGRRRYLPELKSKNFNIRSGAERIAMNTPIQGTAADIIKLAMLRVWRRLRQEGYRSRLILQVHDELILEAPVSEKERVLKLLTDEMEHAMTLCVPLLAEAHAGFDWYTAKG